MIISYLKNLGISLLIFFIGSFLITLLSYFNLLNNTLINIFNIVIPVISLFVGGILTGRISKSKGYLEGIKFGGILIIILILFNILGLNNGINIKLILLCIILLLSSMIGSMIGINKKVDK